MSTILEPELKMGALDKWTRDLKESVVLMPRDQARWLVDIYYQIQKFRIAAGNQIAGIERECLGIAGLDQKSISEMTPPQRRKACAGLPHEPHEVLRLVYDQQTTIENNIKGCLGRFAKRYAVGAWMQSITGVGPVISAGLLAHFDIRKAYYPSQFISFCGLNPTVVWEKKHRRPWNADLKCLVTFLAGECFVKVSNHDSDVYGKIYRAEKDRQAQLNGEGAFKELSAQILIEKNWNKDTDAYKAYSAGFLPPAHVHARGRRFAAKMFVFHIHEMMFRDFYPDEDYPDPYVLKHHGNHTRKISPPNPEAAVGETLATLFSTDPPKPPEKKVLREIKEDTSVE